MSHLLEIACQESVGIQPNEWIVRFTSRIIRRVLLRLLDKDQLAEHLAIDVITHFDTPVPVAYVEKGTAI